MIITFCGHSKIFNGGQELHDKIYSVIEQEAKDAHVKFYLGAYGEFDNLALKVCSRFKRNRLNTELYFISPYLDDKYMTARKTLLEQFDGIIYPPLENTPKKYAIIERNKWIVNQADFIIAYVNHSWGGAAKTLEYAYKKHKKFVNLGNFIPL